MDKIKTIIDKFAPMKFCCYFDHKKGCIIIGGVCAALTALSIIATVLQTVDLKKCDSCSYSSWKQAYAYSVSACIYCCLKFLINLWFIWGVLKEKKTVVLAWVVISALWLVQTSCLLIVLIIEHRSEVGTVDWVISLVFTIIFILTMVYFVLVGYGYWLLLRSQREAPENPEGTEIN